MIRQSLSTLVMELLMSPPISSCCWWGEVCQSPSLRPRRAAVRIFIHFYYYSKTFECLDSRVDVVAECFERHCIGVASLPPRMEAEKVRERFTLLACLSLRVFIHFYKFCYPIVVTLIHTGCYGYEYVLPHLHIIEIEALPPRMRIFPLSRRFFMRMPPVFWLLIMSYLHHSHPRKMGSCHHIGKAGIFVGCRDCRSASVLCLRDRFEFFAYPISFMGGVNLLLINNYLWFYT